MLSKLLQKIRSKFMSKSKTRQINVRKSLHESLEDRHMLTGILSWAAGADIPAEDTKVVISSQEDLDRDGTPDWLDGFGAGGGLLNVDNGGAGQQYFAMLKLSLPAVSSTKTYLFISYNENDPTKVPNDGWVFEDRPEGIRIWAKRANKDRNTGDYKFNGSGGGDYLRPNLYELESGAAKEITFYVEGIDNDSSVSNNFGSGNLEIGDMVKYGKHKITFSVYEEEWVPEDVYNTYSLDDRSTSPSIYEEYPVTRCRAIVNCCVLRNFLSGGFLEDSVFEGPSFDDECDLFVAA